MSIRIRTFHLIFSLLLGCLLASCSTLSNAVQPPTVELASLRVEDPTLSAATFVFGIRVNNPNWFGLHVYGLDYAVTVNQQDFASGRLANLGSVGGGENKVIEVPVRLKYASLVQSAEALDREGKAGYELKGNVLVSGVTVPFNLGGTLALPAR